MLTLSLLSLLACSDPKSDTGGADTATDDTATDDTATDTAETGDTGYDGPTFKWFLGGSVEGGALALHPLDTEAGFEEVLPPWQVVAVSGNVVEMPMIDPPEELLAPIPEFPDTQLVMFTPMLWDDANGDLVHDAGEVYRASSATVVAFLAGTLSPELSALGLALGWNAFELRQTGEPPVVMPATAMQLPLNLDPRESFTFGGDVGGEADGWQLTVYPATTFSGAEAPPLHDAALTDPWSVSLTGRPPESHIQPFEETGAFRGALEIPVAWLDADDIVGLSEGDLSMQPCYLDETGPRQVQITWVEPISDPGFALTFGFMGYNAGWLGLVADDRGEGAPMDEAIAASLSFSSDCTGGF
jgi:hypothetical protein